jgi:hypothetical protein
LDEHGFVEAGKDEGAAQKSDTEVVVKTKWAKIKGFSLGFADWTKQKFVQSEAHKEDANTVINGASTGFPQSFPQLSSILKMTALFKVFLGSVLERLCLHQ